MVDEGGIRLRVDKGGIRFRVCFVCFMRFLGLELILEYLYYEFCSAMEFGLSGI
jgi:hypothetical protein